MILKTATLLPPKIHPTGLQTDSADGVSSSCPLFSLGLIKTTTLLSSYINYRKGYEIL